MAINKRFVAKTGLDNNANSITNLGVTGASLTLSGTNDLTITTTGSTGVTMPLTGTLATLSNDETLSTKTIASSTGLKFAGATSGTTVVQAAATATGTLTLPAATDTLIGKATADVLTNKTFDTAGTGNVFKINGTQVSAITGTGSAVLATSPSLTTPTLGVASATTINKVSITTPATGSTLTIADGKTLTASNTLTFTGTDAISVAFGGGGTVVYTSNKLSALSSTTSAELAGVISDETGSGVLVFGTSPTFTTSMDSGATFGAFASSTTLTIGYTGIAASTTHISNGTNGNGVTKIVNIGTGGAVGSTTNVNIGGGNGGTTTINRDLSVQGNAVFEGNLTVKGNTTTLSSLTLEVLDKNIELAKVASPDNTSADGAGITVKGTTDKTIIWDSTNSNWTSSEHWNIASTKVFKINNVEVLSSTKVLGLTPGGTTAGDLVTINATQTLTNKTISGANNTLSNIANNSLTNSSITINGSAVSLGGSVTVSATATAALTISSPLSGTSYNGSTAATIALASSYGDTQNPYASKTQKYVLAAPNAADGVPTFRALLASDIPTLNQNTTGSAATLTTPRAINGVNFDGSAAITVTAAAGTLTGTTLNATVVTSSLTSVGTIGTGTWQGSAIADTYLSTISTSGKVSNSATTATSANTASAIVARDASGNFTAGTITAALTGNASTATTLATARNINGVSFNGSADITVTAAAGTLTGATLNSGVTASSLTSVGTIGTGVWQGSAIADTYLSTISTSGKVSNSATTATSANTASAIVARDASGNFTAGTITASLTGNVSGSSGSCTGNAATATKLSLPDLRSTSLTPSYFGPGINGAFMSNATDSLSDGGTYHGVIQLQQWSDASGGGAHQLGFTDNNNIWHRGSSGGVTSWASWYKLIDTNNYGSSITSLTAITNISTGAAATAGTITGDWSLGSGSKLRATYADLAENYVSDQSYDYGIVLMIGGDEEVTIATEETQKLAGVVSKNPAYLMNSECEGKHVVAIALQGRTPVRVMGKVNKGDFLVSAGDGYAKATDNPRIGSIIGKSLESFDGQYGMVEAMVGRL